jgi:hypothetical protein
MVRGVFAWAVTTPQVCGLSMFRLGVEGWK